MPDKAKNEVMIVENIESLVYTIRGQQVMLDADLAVIYGYEVRALNQQVKRNIERFPADFMFQLTMDEALASKSQNVILNESGNKRGSNIKKLPFAFTEQGVNMLATVLKSDLAIQQSIAIMRAFKNMRHYLAENGQLASKRELSQLALTVSTNQAKTDAKFEAVERKIDALSSNFISGKERKEIVIYKGQKFEADVAYTQIYILAKKTIYVVDNYVNIKTLNLLRHKGKNVSVTLFTENMGHGRNALTASEVTDFNTQYPVLTVKPNGETHDRLIILDYKKKTERIFHCGASSKDAGKKVCAINEISDTALYHPIIDRLLQEPDFPL